MKITDPLDENTLAGLDYIKTHIIGGNVAGSAANAIISLEERIRWLLQVVEHLQAKLGQLEEIGCELASVEQETGLRGSDYVDAIANMKGEIIRLRSDYTADERIKDLLDRIGAQDERASAAIHQHNALRARIESLTNRVISVSTRTGIYNGDSADFALRAIEDEIWKLRAKVRLYQIAESAQKDVPLAQAIYDLVTAIKDQVSRQETES